jgi:hypothetical protein
MGGSYIEGCPKCGSALGSNSIIAYLLNKGPLTHHAWVGFLRSRFGQLERPTPNSIQNLNKVHKAKATATFNFVNFVTISFSYPSS